MFRSMAPTSMREKALYLLDDTWYLTKKEDFLWMGAFSVQAAYGIGRGPFSYIYSKDCNRDVEDLTIKRSFRHPLLV